MTRSESIEKQKEALIITRALGLFMIHFTPDAIEELKKESREFATQWEVLSSQAEELAKETGWPATIPHTSFWKLYLTQVSFYTQSLIMQKALKLQGDFARETVELSIRTEKAKAAQKAKKREVKS